jgi:hypothetical protein
MYTCRQCDREINQATELCPYCGADLTVPEPDEAATPRKKPKLVPALLRWGVLLAAMWLFLWFILPERAPSPGGRAAHAEERALAALREAQAALESYARIRDGEYPPSLEALGADAASVRRAAQQAQGEGYVLHYDRGPADPDGRSRRYALRARAAFHGYRNFYTDQTGQLRATRENRQATEHDPPV